MVDIWPKTLCIWWCCCCCWQIRSGLFCYDPLEFPFLATITKWPLLMQQPPCIPLIILIWRLLFCCPLKRHEFTTNHKQSELSGTLQSDLIPQVFFFLRSFSLFSQIFTNKIINNNVKDLKELSAHKPRYCTGQFIYSFSQSFKRPFRPQSQPTANSNRLSIFIAWEHWNVCSQ